MIDVPPFPTETYFDRVREAHAKAKEQEINFDSDEPLEGGVCDMDGGCESCQ